MESKEFDVLLGGMETLPPSLSVGEFLKSRLDEIEALTHVIENPSTMSSKRDFPKHMRRRAMSHNIKRIPKRIRALHEVLREKSNTREGSNKVPRRKFRRRPSEMLLEYNRRQRKFVWLETHIWHAKRFNMVEKWGYKLAMYPSDKSYRACYRATSEHCLVQDMSYYNCIEIQGELNCILEGLKCHSCETVGVAFDSNLVVDGRREGRTMFYKSGQRPSGAIGEVSYVWKPADSSKHRTLWIWAHPSYSKEVVEELVSTFGLEKKEIMETEEMDDGDESVEMKKLASRMEPVSYSNAGFRLIFLKDCLNRFRLTGPLSQAVIFKGLCPISGVRRCEDWTLEYYAGERAFGISQLQREVWERLGDYSSPAQLPANMVVPLVVIDPRFTLPKNRSKAVNDESEDSIVSPLSVESLDSPLWNKEIRDKITCNKLSTHQINSMRTNKIVPGVESEIDSDQQQSKLPAVPILLIQRPGSHQKGKRLGYGSGWDVITPAGYGMPFWMSFVLNGGRAGGLRENNLIERESGEIGFLPPDTVGGRKEEIEVKNELTDKHFRLPPAKRLNYIKLGIPSPFKCQWELLTKEWSGSEDYYVLRDKASLRNLMLRLEYKYSVMVMEPPGALVPVIITLRGKGNLPPFSHICHIPNSDSNSTPTPLPKVKPLMKLEEPLHSDPNLKNRDELASVHATLLKRLARKRKQNKDARKEFDSKQVREEHEKIMRDLWLPANSSIRFFTSQIVFGFVTNGDFSFMASSCAGVGFVSLEGLLVQLSTTTPNLVLVRATNSSVYRLADLRISV